MQVLQSGLSCCVCCCHRCWQKQGKCEGKSVPGSCWKCPAGTFSSGSSRPQMHMGPQSFLKGFPWLSLLPGVPGPGPGAAAAAEGAPGANPRSLRDLSSWKTQLEQIQHGQGAWGGTDPDAGLSTGFQNAFHRIPSTELGYFTGFQGCWDSPQGFRDAELFTGLQECWICTGLQGYWGICRISGLLGYLQDCRNAGMFAGFQRC